MIQIEKKKISKKNLSIIITASVLAALILAYVIISAVINSLSGGGNNNTEKPVVNESIGEAVSGTATLAFANYSNTEIEGIVIDSHNGKFSIYRSDDEQYFFFCYEDENGDIQLYYPDIVGQESSFDYTDLYATESDTGLNIYKLTYLLSSVTTLYFDQRIELSTDATERQKQLNRYGLSDDEKETLVVLRTDENGNNIKYTIEIGNKLLAGSGYYYRVTVGDNERDVVYTCNSDAFKYALGGFEAFLHSRVVAEGLEEDSAFEPYLTTDYKQWKNTVVYYDKDKAVQAVVDANSTVIVNGSVMTPIYDESAMSESEKAASNGYEESKDKGMSFDLPSLAALTQYNRLTAALSGKYLGDYSNGRLPITVVSDTLEVNFGENDSAAYNYTVVAIESILCTDGEYNESGKSANDYQNAEMVKVTYNYSVGDESNTVARHAVIDLNDPLVAPVRDRLSDAKIGEDQSIEFTVNYDKDNTRTKGIKYVITEIALIYNVTEDKNVVAATTVTEKSLVTYRYCLMMGDKVLGEVDSNTVDMAALTEGNYLDIKEALLGKSAGKQENCVAFENVTHLQVMRNFTAYSIKSIDYFYTKEMVSSFEFVNASVRDTFYGESLYINTLPSTNPYKNYALNSSSCETVVRLLGGIGDDSTTDSSLGLMGTETVAVGLTPEVMNKYGLYANTIYFELPRGIQTESTGNADDLDDYTYIDLLGFNIYISDYDKEQKCRYAASDMYGVVVKIEDEGFDYLDLSFTDFWARRSLVMVNFKHIEQVTLDLYMTDVYGSYTFETITDPIWILNGKHYTEPVEGGTAYDFLTVNAYSNGASSGNKLTEYLGKSDEEYMSIANLYNRVASDKEGREQWLSIGNDTAGASYFKELLFVMYNTYYTGSLTEAEQAAAKNGPKLMEISFTVSGSEKDTYRYQFYRLDDRRIMVSLSNPGWNNEVTDFYISNFAFKKLVSNFERLMNGEEIIPDEAYNY